MIITETNSKYFIFLNLHLPPSYKVIVLTIKKLHRKKRPLKSRIPCLQLIFKIVDTRRTCSYGSTNLEMIRKE